MTTIARYWRATRDALAEERTRATGRLRSQELDFLPAALEVIERPVSPTGRVTAWVLIVGLFVTIGWLVFGLVDVVATAQGRIVPSDEVKLVQASNSGIVRRIYVHDGDIVRRGQPLIDLDPTVSTADQAQAQKGLMEAELNAARNKAIADALIGRGLHFTAPAGTSLDIIDTQRRLIAAQLAVTEAAASSLAAARQSSLADANSAAQQVRKFDDTVPVLDRELSAMNGLAAKGYAPGMRLLELQRQRRSEAGDRDVALAQRARGDADARKFGDQAAQTRQQARQQALTDLAKAQNDVILRREELTKATQRSRLQRLYAPEDGTVQQIAVHTLGGVAEAVKPLMIVVPGGALTVEAQVLNKDAGFVRVGQQVSVKLEAFPYTRYGTVAGRISSISRDAIQDKRTGPYYLARIRLDRTTVMTERGRIRLSPGLTTTSDIRIGSRRIISYLVSPLAELHAEAGREK
jgi:hemolysin D